jgi:tetratricopeptide (TPR) repeat protein
MVYSARICRRPGEFYAAYKLGAIGSNLAAVSSFFDRPFEALFQGLPREVRPVILNHAAFHLCACGRLTESLPVDYAVLQMAEESGDWGPASIGASNLSLAELLLGDVASSVSSATRSIKFADRAGDEFQKIVNRVTYGVVLDAAGRRAEAEELFANARRQRERQPGLPLLYSVQGYRYCGFLLSKGEWVMVRDQATQTLDVERRNNWVIDIALDELNLGRAYLGLALTSRERTANRGASKLDARAAIAYLSRAADGLRASENNEYLPKCLLARAIFHRSVGSWGGAMRHLDEVQEIAELGRMRLYLCDLSLERGRLALARSEAFAPLNGLTDNSPVKPEPPSKAERDILHDEAAQQLAIAADFIEKCGYHLRDEELAELQAALRGERTFASLPPRV